MTASRRVEVVGIGPLGVTRHELTSGDLLAAWRLSEIQAWHINWELGELILILAPAPTLAPLNTDAAENMVSCAKGEYRIGHFHGF
ncbi:unnamed protein product [Protopolystoma xenopodis]|uniref:Uncharacterized protein n=1 Tax=Protopolystoma xenopodis TaxID=117903 RepID=A0A448XNV0_9PLAT|nr:unnamed protein product [Protopolystoma xenopodis]